MMQASEIVEIAGRCVICGAFAIVSLVCARRTSIVGAIGLALAAFLDAAQAVGFAIAWQTAPPMGWGVEYFNFRRTIHLASIGCNFATAALFVGSLVMLRVARDPAAPPDAP